MKISDKFHQLAAQRRHARDLKAPGPVQSLEPYSVPAQRRSPGVGQFP